MRDLPYTEYRELTGGMDDKSDNTEMSPTRFQLIENLYVLNDSLIKRPGYANNFGSALSVNAIQSMKQYSPTNASEGGLLSVTGGTMYYDDTEISGSYTLSTAAAAVISAENYDDRMIITDGVNPMIYWPDNKDTGTGGVQVIQSNSMPSRVGVIAEFKERIFMGDITDVDGVSYPYRVMSTEVGRIDVGSADSTNDLNKSQKVTAMVRHGDSLLAMQNRSTWRVLHSPDFQNLNADPFVYQELSNAVGTYNQNTITHTQENGTFFISRKGVYWIPPGDPQQPIYISTAIETFWYSVNHNVLSGACCIEIPEMNGVLVCVPYRSSTTNNRAIFINYQNMAELERGRITGAFSIWKGEDAQPFAFRSAARLVKNGRERSVLGNYSGTVSLFGDVLTDSGTGIAWRFKTPFYGPGGRGREKIWYGFTFDVDFNEIYNFTVTVTQQNNTQFSRTLSGTGGTASSAYLGPTGGPLGQVWTLGESVLAIDRIGSISGDLRNRSRFIELDARASANGNNFALHGIILYYKLAGTWAL